MSETATRAAIEEALGTWKYVRMLTYELLKKCPQRTLTRRLPRPGLNQIGKHFLELGDVTMAYARGLREGMIEFDDVRWVFPRAELASKAAIARHLKKSDAALSRALRKAQAEPDRQYCMGPETLSLTEVISWLTLHETLHHGQLVAYGYLVKLKFPASWSNQWALPASEAN